MQLNLDLNNPSLNLDLIRFNAKYYIEYKYTMKRKIDEWNLFHIFSKNRDHFFFLNLKFLNFFNLK